jgi:hypothetical protein
VTISNGFNFAQMRTFNGSSWVLPGVVIDGSLLVSGTITTAKLVVGALVGYTIETAGSGPRWALNGIGSSAAFFRGLDSGGSTRVTMDAGQGTIVASAASGFDGSQFSATSPVFGLSAHNFSTGSGLRASSSLGFGVQANGNATRAPILLTNLGSLPSNRTLGSLCCFSGNLHFANGVHWYRVGGLVQVT